MLVKRKPHIWPSTAKPGMWVCQLDPRGICDTGIGPTPHIAFVNWAHALGADVPRTIRTERANVG